MKLVLLLATVLATVAPVFSQRQCSGPVCDCSVLELQCPPGLVPTGICKLNGNNVCEPCCQTSPYGEP